MQSTPQVLFICVRNSGKSQMAAALAQHHAGERLDVFSAGTEPGASLNQQSVEALAEVGVDMAKDHPKPIDGKLLRSADRVVVLGQEARVDLPADASGTLEQWLIDEPSERGVEGMERMRLVRDDIDAKVRNLVAEMLKP